MSRVRVTISKLILKGFEPDQRQPLAEMLQAELTWALSDPATRAQWARSQHRQVMRIGDMTLGPGRAGSRKLGSGIAQAIGEGVKR